MKKFLILLTCAVILSGCTKSNIVTPDSTEGTIEAKQPDFDVKDDVEIDWQQASVDAESIFGDTDEYPYSVDFHFYLQPEQKEIMLVWVVEDDLPTDAIVPYAEALIKGFNDVVATQDFSIQRSGSDSYGGLWGSYGLSYGLAPESTQDDESTWFASGNYAAGTEFKLPSSEEIQKAIDSMDTEDGGGAQETEAAPAPEAAEETEAAQAAE